MLMLNVDTKQLSRYVLPQGYIYTDPRFSPRGNFIVLTRIPTHDASKEGIRRSVEQAQIVCMRVDGSNFKIIPVRPGRKLLPIMSADETKIAYLRQVPLKGERFMGDWSHNEIWEYDLKTGIDQLFAGPFQFLSVLPIQYVAEDEILLQSFATESTLKDSKYQITHNYSEVYKLKRHTATNEYPDPIFTNIEYATQPSMDTEGNTYLQGVIPSKGTSIVKISPTGAINYWVMPGELAQSGPRQFIVSPDGRYETFSYATKGGIAFGMIDTTTGKWLPITIPTLQTSTPIFVQQK